MEDVLRVLDHSRSRRGLLLRCLSRLGPLLLQPPSDVHHVPRHRPAGGRYRKCRAVRPRARLRRFQHVGAVLVGGRGVKPPQRGRVARSRCPHRQRVAERCREGGRRGQGGQCLFGCRGSQRPRAIAASRRVHGAGLRERRLHGRRAGLPGRHPQGGPLLDRTFRSCNGGEIGSGVGLHGPLLADLQREERQLHHDLRLPRVVDAPS
mmetsp:Transcript_25712/g.51850  ORF Transcript_25712/g.51850 Transcript_25712/m.51850 type:complete len:207 (-) Transcript_25712:593-1213(-)